MADVGLTIIPGMVRNSVLEGGGVGDVMDVDGVNKKLCPSSEGPSRWCGACIEPSRSR